MLNRRITALLLAAALALSLCGATALAAEGDPAEPSPADQETVSQDIPKEESRDQKEPAGEAVGDGEAPEEAPGPAGTVSFEDLAGRVRSGCYNLLALEETIASIEAIDYEKMSEDVRKQLNDVVDMQWSLVEVQLPPTGNQIQDGINGIFQSTLNSSASQSLDQAYDALRETYDDLKAGKIQEDNAGVVRQLRSAQDKIVMAAESIYVALTELERSAQSLDRSLAAMDRTIQEMELRYDLGQISALTLQQVKGGRTSLVSGQQTLDMNIGNLKTQLELMLGAQLTGSIQLQALPQVTGEQLAAMDLEADLAAAKEASYDLYAAGKTLEQAREDFEEKGDEYNHSEKKYQYVSAQHTWQGAQYTYEAAVQSFELSFRTLYAQVKDYAQVLEAARTALAVEQDNYAASQLKYEQGTLSRNKLLDAADQVSAAQDTVDGAAIDLFSAYHNYRWAVDHGILN